MKQLKTEISNKINHRNKYGRQELTKEKPLFFEPEQKCFTCANKKADT